MKKHRCENCVWFHEPSKQTYQLTGWCRVEPYDGPHNTRADRWCSRWEPDEASYRVCGNCIYRGCPARVDGDFCSEWKPDHTLVDHQPIEDTELEPMVSTPVAVDYEWSDKRSPLVEELIVAERHECLVALCRERGMQNCHDCPDAECIDNLNSEPRE